MNRIRWVLGVLLLLGGLVWADAPATPPSVPATQAAASSTQSALSSKPVTKDGLSVTVTLPKATFAADEPLKFMVQFKNVSEKPFTLYDVDWFWAWSMRFEDVARKGSWQLFLMAAFKRAKFSTLACKPGEAVEVLVDLGKDDLPLEFVWKGEKAEPVLPLKQLKPGKYRLTMEITLLEDVRKWAPPVQSAYWIGKITTEPVEIEITDKPASPATQPADANAAWKAVVAALEAGDKVALAKATTEKGYTSIMDKEGKTLTPEEMKVRGARWGTWNVQFSRKTDDAATANVVAPMTDGGIWVKFIKTAEGWKTDGWAPGE